MQAKGQAIRAVIELGRFPGMVLVVKKEHAGKVKTFGDLKGMKIGVTAPGSSTHFLLNALIGKDGLKPEDVSVIGVGMFGFTLSWDEIARTSQATGDLNTLPLELQGLTTTVTTPVIYALGTVTTAISLAVIAICVLMVRTLGAASRRRPE